jgi:hypothetical protein
MQYNFNEGSLTLPDVAMADGSLNILRFPKLGTSLIISRAPLAKGDTLEKNFEDQVQKLEKQMTDMRFQSRENINIGPNNDIPAIQAKNQFKRGTDQVYQYQLACIEPFSGQMFALTYVKSTPLGEAESKHWEVIKTKLAFASK